MARALCHVPENERYSEEDIELLRKTIGLDWMDGGDPIYGFPTALEIPESYEILLSLHETGKMPIPSNDLPYYKIKEKVDAYQNALEELQRDHVVDYKMRIKPKFEKNLDLIFMIDREKLKGYFQQIRVELAESADDMQRSMQPTAEQMLRPIGASAQDKDAEKRTEILELIRTVREHKLTPEEERRYREMSGIYSDFSDEFTI
ncbi:MAG: hypothetical protein PHU12_01370 [Candidatus Aenigmarchaeota archaeon]|nr:hypothetical protein [Candidatus Aenigmarchaeota archaeon]